MGSILGKVASVEIAAHGFSVDGNPFFCDPMLSRAGKLGELRLKLSDFSVRDLRVRELSAVIPNCRFALGMMKEGKVRLSLSGEGPGAVTLSAPDFRAYMLSRFKAIESLDVRLDRYKLFAKGRAAFGPIRRDFEIICDLEISEKRKLVIANPVVFVDGRMARDGSGNSVANAFNPVMDIDKDLGMAGAFDMQRLVARNGVVVITGVARVPNRPTSPNRL